MDFPLFLHFHYRNIMPLAPLLLPRPPHQDKLITLKYHHGEWCALDSQYLGTLGCLSSPIGGLNNKLSQRLLLEGARSFPTKFIFHKLLCLALTPWIIPLLWALSGSSQPPFVYFSSPIKFKGQIFYGHKMFIVFFPFPLWPRIEISTYCLWSSFLCGGRWGGWVRTFSVYLASSFWVVI